jgi:hypothetical protein
VQPPEHELERLRKDARAFRVLGLLIMAVFLFGVWRNLTMPITLRFALEFIVFLPISLTLYRLFWKLADASLLNVHLVANSDLLMVNGKTLRIREIASLFPGIYFGGIPIRMRVGCFTLQTKSGQRLLIRDRMISKFGLYKYLVEATNRGLFMDDATG